MDFSSLLQGGKCVGCNCKIEHFGVCDACAQKFDDDRGADLRNAARATIPGNLRWATFDAPELADRVRNPEAVKLARLAAEGVIAKRIRSVVLLGPAGAGKTSLACAMMRLIVPSQVGRTAHFQGTVGLAKARSDSGLGDRPYAVDASIRSTCLVLDDLGQEDPRGEHVVREVLHQRFDSPVPMPQIVTTWMDKAAVYARYGEGTGRRVFEHAAIVRVG